MKELLKIVFSFIITQLGRIIPIRPNVFVFNSLPDVSDNAYAVFLELNKRHDLILVWLVDEKKDYSSSLQINTMNKIKVLKKKSMSAIYYFLRAKMIVVTHSIYCNYKNLNKRKILLNTGHGMPLKRIGFMDGKSWIPNLDYTICTSPIFQILVSKCYGLPIDKVLITGSPKSDLLFLESDFYTNHSIDKHRYSMIGAWLPTFRATKSVFTRNDGHFEENRISILSLDEMYEFNNFLKQKNVLLVIKLHPMDLLQECTFKQYSNLLILKQSDLTIVR